jgi:hypothetical protein
LVGSYIDRSRYENMQVLYMYINVTCRMSYMHVLNYFYILLVLYRTSSSANCMIVCSKFKDNGQMVRFRKLLRLV